MFNKTWINSCQAWAAQHKKNVDLKEYLPLESFQVLCQFYGEIRRVGGEVLYLITVEGRTVVKCICECNQSGCRVSFYPEPVAMSTTFSGWSNFCNISALLLIRH